MGFWIGIVVMVAIVVGGSVLAGMAINGRAARRNVTRSKRAKEVEALKVSGALSHRKSNQP